MSATLVTDRLAADAVALRPLLPSDADALYVLLADWEVARMLAAVPWPATPESIQDYTARSAAPDAESLEFAVAAAGRLVGAASLRRPGAGEPPRTMPRLGYWIGRRYWGRGIATEAVRLLVREAFRRHPGAAMIGAGVFLDNPVSRRVLEKLGFRESSRYRTFSRSAGRRWRPPT